MKINFIDLNWIENGKKLIPISINTKEISYYKPDVYCSNSKAPEKLYSELLDTNRLSEYPTIITLKSSFDITVAESYTYIQKQLNNR